MKKSLNEVLQNDDLIYNRMLDMGQEQLVSMILSFAENNPSVTLVDYLNNEFGYIDENKTTIKESLEILKMKKLAGLLKEGEYAKALLKEYELDDNKLQAFIDRYNKLPRKMGTLDGGDKSYIKDYIKSNPTKLVGEFDDALFSDEATAKFLNGLLDTPRGQNISFMKAKSQYKSKPSWVTGNDANPWGPGYDYEEYEEVPGI